jgi:hypothetical protein
VCYGSTVRCHRDPKLRNFLAFISPLKTPFLIYRERERESAREVPTLREVGRIGDKTFVAYSPGLPEEHHEEVTNSDVTACVKLVCEVELRNM